MEMSIPKTLIFKNSNFGDVMDNFSDVDLPDLVDIGGAVAPAVGVAPTAPLKDDKDCILGAVGDVDIGPVGPLAPTTSYGTIVMRRWYYIGCFSATAAVMLLLCVAHLVWGAMPGFRESYQLRWQWALVQDVGVRFSSWVSWPFDAEDGGVYQLLGPTWLLDIASWVHENVPYFEAWLVVPVPVWRLVLRSLWAGHLAAPLLVSAVMCCCVSGYSFYRCWTDRLCESERCLRHLSEMALKESLDTRVTTIQQTKETLEPVAFAVLSGIRDEVEYLTLGKARTSAGWVTIAQAFDRKWRLEQVPMGTMLAQKRMLYACYWTIPPVERELRQYVCSKASRDIIRAHNSKLGLDGISAYQ